MKIALLGYYGHGNAGDERILQCAKKMFQGHSFVIADAWGDAASRIDEINSCDFVLLGGGGLIVPGLNDRVSFVQSIKTRFGCIGLGVEYRDKSNDDLVKVLEDKSEFIWVRDRGSAELINRPTIMGGDLTFIDPFPVVFPREQDVCGVNPPWGRTSQEVEQCKRVLVNNFTSLIRLPLFDWGEPWEEIFKPPDFLLAQYAKCNYIIGQRFHSVVFAIQSGLPFIAFPYAPKSQRLCEESGLSHYALSDIEDLGDKILTMRRDCYQIRKQVLRFRETTIVAAEDAMGIVKNIMGVD